MKIIFFSIFTLIIFNVLSPSTTSKGQCPDAEIICQYTQHWNVKYQFDVSEVLPSCKVVAYGWYLLDRYDDIDSYVAEADKNAIRSLVACQKTVYTILANDGCECWSDLFEPTDEAKYNDIFTPLIKFLVDFGLSGILINMPPIYDGTLKNPTESIVKFVNDLKKKVNNIKVGLVINGYDHANFSNKTLFDFIKTNPVLDHYLVDLTQTNTCNETTRHCSMNPITSNNPDMVTLTQISEAISCSDIDKNKVIARLQVGVYIPQSATEKTYDVRTSYTEYCGSTDTKNTSTWCSDTSETLYNQGKFATKYYCGILLWGLETDDFENKCGCGKYSISNLIIDGWECNPMKPCPKLDQL